MAEESVGRALLLMKCPKCHVGELFISKNTYNLRRMHEMPDACLSCGQPFQPEPGFYTGAMYVNYGLTVVLSALAYLILDILLGLSAFAFFSIYLAILFLIGPLMFRYSRVIYLYMFVDYDVEALKKHKLPN